MLGFVWFAHSYLTQQGCCTDMANGLVEFGAAFTLLGKSENGAIALAMANLGRTADSLAVVAKKHVSGSGSGTRHRLAVTHIVRRNSMLTGGERNNIL